MHGAIDVDVLRFDEDNDGDDLFTLRLLTTDERGEYLPMSVDRDILLSLHRREVLVKKWLPPLRYQYFRSILPDVQIRLCSSCNQVSGWRWEGTT